MIDDSHRIAAGSAGYALGPQVGEGSFKICYFASREGTDVAFKVLKTNAVIARTKRELKAMRDCSHANIAPCIDSGVAVVNGVRIEYVVEPFFANGSLADRLKHRRLSRAEAISLGSQMIEAIAHLSERELVHRDIKPENIMYDANDIPQLTDLGIVRALGETSLTDSAHPFGLGTRTFMPGEQYHNEKAMIDWRADQFALGVTLAVSALGMHPFGNTLLERNDNIAAYRQPSAVFAAATGTFGLPVLVRMVQPYPIGRYNDVTTLLKDWAAQDD